MDFFNAFFGALPFGLGFAVVGLDLATGLGLKGCLVGFLLLIIRLRFVDVALFFFYPESFTEITHLISSMSFICSIFSL